MTLGSENGPRNKLRGGRKEKKIHRKGNDGICFVGHKNNRFVSK